MVRHHATPIARERAPIASPPPPRGSAGTRGVWVILMPFQAGNYVRVLYFSLSLVDFLKRGVKGRMVPEGGQKGVN